MTGGVFFAWCDAGDTKGAFTMSVATMAADSRCPVTRYARLETGPRLAEARNQLVDGFAATDCEWLLFVDSDMVFAADMPQRLLAAGHPIVGALCRTSEGKPTMFRFINDDLESERVEQWDDGDIVEVDATGTGCLLVHRSVFARLKDAFGMLESGAENPYPWFVEGMTSRKGEPFGEDTAFPVALDTPVLDAEWRWRPISSFDVGEQVMAFDENSPRYSSRRYQRATVTGIVERRLPRLRIITTEREVVTTAEHPWLSRAVNPYPEKTAWRWRRADALTPGLPLASVMPVEANPDLTSPEYAAGYVKGLIDSDGTSRPGAHVVRMKDVQPLERLATMLALVGAESVRGAVRWDGDERHAPMHRLGVYRRASAERVDAILHTSRMSKMFAAGYLAGMFDGDGSHHGNALHIHSIVDSRKDELEHAARIIGVPFSGRDGRSVWLHGNEQMFRFWQRTLPSLSRRTAPIGQLANDGTRGGKEVLHRPETVLAVESMSADDVMCLTTTSSTFIADGLASHNCVRARSLGIPIFVHTGVKVGHIKSRMVGEVA